MEIPNERAQVVWWYAETKSIIQVQRNFRRVYNKDPPTHKTVKAWCNQFLATGNVMKGHGGGIPRIQENVVENVQST
ncbi:hypothetical protein C0J52_25552 [Blattella germanica]|nr:hypothetical protein C0J52_25552 [Blattella germanica]